MEQKNIEVQRKKGLNLMMKILITAIIPLIILVAFAGLAIRAVGVTVSDKLMQHEIEDIGLCREPDNVHFEQW